MFKRTRVSEDCLSDLKLDKLLASSTERSQHPHLARCDRCNDRLSALAAERRHFAEELVPLAELVGASESLPAVSSHHVKERARGRAPNQSRAPKRDPWYRRWRLQTGIGGLAVVAAILALVVWPRSSSSPQNGDGGTRIKGNSSLGFYVNSGGIVRQGTSGETLFSGDSVRFAYTTKRGGHLAILSIDGDGALSIYHDEESGPAAIVPGTDVALPHAIELDDVLGLERVVGFFCDHRPQEEALRAAALSERGSLSGCTRAEIQWRKVER